MEDLALAVMITPLSIPMADNPLENRPKAGRLAPLICSESLILSVPVTGLKPVPRKVSAISVGSSDAENSVILSPVGWCVWLSPDCDHAG